LIAEVAFRVTALAKQREGVVMASAGIKIDDGELADMLSVVKDITKRVKEIKNSMSSLADSIGNNELPVEHGLSFSEVKLHILLDYCTCMVLYIMLKAEGTSIKNHPVVGRIVTLRTMVEKMRPLDQKLRYQIDKLLKTASLGPEQVLAATRETTEEGAVDPLAFRPMASSLVSEGGAMEGGDAAEGSAAAADAPAAQTTARMDGLLARGGGDGVYRPPKITPASLEESENAAMREAKQKKRTKYAAAAPSPPCFLCLFVSASQYTLRCS